MSTDAQPRLAVFSMQKDEPALLPHWAKYYTSLFGAQNVYIVDNGSTDPSFKAQLAGLSAQGISIASRDAHDAFENKGHVLREVAQNACRLHEYDFLYFCDADEFLVSLVHNEPRSDVESIHGELARLANSANSLFRISTGILNIPHTTSGFFDYYGSKKVIVRPAALPSLDLDLGFHLYDWAKRRDLDTAGHIELTSFGFVHAHHRPYNEYQTSARAKLSARVDTASIDQLRRYRGAGHHLVARLLMTEEEYSRDMQFPNARRVPIAQVFSQWNLRPPYA